MFSEIKNKLKEKSWRYKHVRIEKEIDNIKEISNSELDYIKESLDMKLTHFGKRLLQEKDIFKDLNTDLEQRELIDDKSLVSLIETLFSEKERIEMKLKEMDLRKEQSINELKKQFQKEISTSREELGKIRDILNDIRTGNEQLRTQLDRMKMELNNLKKQKKMRK